MESALLGAVGTVAGLVNAFPEETLRLWKLATEGRYAEALDLYRWFTPVLHLDCHPKLVRSEEHTSELQSLMRISYAVFCLKKKKNTNTIHTQPFIQ